MRHPHIRHEKLLQFCPSEKLSNGTTKEWKKKIATHTGATNYDEEGIIKILDIAGEKSKLVTRSGGSWHLCKKSRPEFCHVLLLFAGLITLPRKLFGKLHASIVGDETSDEDEEEEIIELVKRVS